MATRISTAARNAAAGAIALLVDGGSGPGKLRIYSGTQPATPDTAPSGTLLAEYTLSDPGFAAAALGVSAVDVTPALSTSGLAAGTAGYWRMVDSTQAAGSGLGIVDGTVTAIGGGGELQINSTTVSVGVTVDVTSGSITMPGS